MVDDDNDDARERDEFRAREKLYRLYKTQIRRGERGGVRRISSSSLIVVINRRRHLDLHLLGAFFLSPGRRLLGFVPRPLPASAKSDVIDLLQRSNIGRLVERRRRRDKQDGRVVYELADRPGCVILPGAGGVSWMDGVFLFLIDVGCALPCLWLVLSPARDSARLDLSRDRLLSAVSRAHKPGIGATRRALAKEGGWMGGWEGMEKKSKAKVKRWWGWGWWWWWWW